MSSVTKLKHLAGIGGQVFYIINILKHVNSLQSIFPSCLPFTGWVGVAGGRDGSNLLVGEGGGVVISWRGGGVMVGGL
jgi:hypothetical protein